MALRRDVDESRSKRESMQMRVDADESRCRRESMQTRVDADKSRCRLLSFSSLLIAPCYESGIAIIKAHPLIDTSRSRRGKIDFIVP